MSGNNLTAASNQWATRPADERFWSVSELANHCAVERNFSREATVRIGQMEAKPLRNNGLGIVNREKPDSAPLHLTAWSTGLLCATAGIAGGAEELGQYPAELASQMLNHRLERRREDNAELLFTGGNGYGDGKLRLRAITSDRYERLWDADLTAALAKVCEDHGWRTPPARPYPGGETDPRTRRATVDDVLTIGAGGGVAVKEGDMISPAGVYRGVKDMFIFLVNPRVRFDDGNTGLFPGLFIRNSEVRGGSFSVTSFLLEGVCGNHIVWGAHEVRRHSMRHIGKSMVAQANFRMGMAFDASPIDFTATLQLARSKELGKNREEVVQLVTEKRIGLTQKAADAAFSFAEQWEKTARSAPTTVWGFVHGLTRYSQTLGGFADKRADLDAIGGKILALAV